MIILRTRRLGFNAVPTLPFTMFTVSLLVVPRMPSSFAIFFGLMGVPRAPTFLECSRQSYAAYVGGFHLEC